MLLLSEAQMEVARLLEQLSLADRFFLSFFLSLASSLFSLLSSLFYLPSSLFSLVSFVLMAFVLVWVLVTLSFLVSRPNRPVTEMVACSGKGRARSYAFEYHVRSLLASGCSARSAREQLLQSSRNFFETRSCSGICSACSKRALVSNTKGGVR